ncbi:hypothetical protein [Streptomyces sp. NPDC050538]|uniref:hypothetical protein n=1 Tax=Streptomyces sp. NPDC050538 TaxID=3365627 RepID=UPI0037917DF4
MTPWLRTLPSLRATGLLLVLGTGAVVSPCGSLPAYGVEAGSGASTGGDRVTVTAPASGAASASPSASALRPASGPDAPHASAEPSRAGSRAGEGRERPGRTAEPTADEDENEGEDTAGLTADGDDGGSPSASPASPAPADSASSQEAAPVPSSPPLQPLRQTVTRAEGSAEPVLRILPLGSGLILIGLGLGLAFIALRVRRS